MKFVCYTDWNQVPASADELFAGGEKESIFLSRPWYENLAAGGLEDDQAMILACVVDDDRILAILPLTKSTASTTGYSLRHRYTPFYSLLLARAGQDQILECLARGLGELPLEAVLLEPVSDTDSRVNGLQQALESTGYSCQRIFRLYNWVLDVGGQSYADYMAARPARLRNTIARKKRKLEREHGYRVRLFCGDEVLPAMADYYAVYSASWKANEQFTGFVDGMVAGFSRAGWSRLGVLYIEDQPVAAQLWFVLHGKAYIFRLAYDEAWKPYSPGTLLTAFLMEHVIDTDGVTEVDFLSGNDPYKQDWMSGRRERYALSCIKNKRSANESSQVVQLLKKIIRRR